jgi:transcription-repair coupling factor (superfamily II helicase)
VRLDFLALSPVEESPKSKVQSAKSGGQSTVDSPQSGIHAAYIPFSYISDSRLRIEVYRKVAQASETAALQDLNRELRDRFGPLPSSLELLLKVAELKILAAERGITTLEVKEDKVMLTRDTDYIMIAGKFPRLKRKEPTSRLKEIKKLILALQIQQ